MPDLVTIDITGVNPELTDRALVVQSELLDVKNSIEDNFLRMCKLLLEAKDNNYHVVYGFSQFADWIEQGSGLDLSSRSAFYYINVYRKALSLGITEDQLKAVKFSKLKEIFSLEPEEHGAVMLQLVEAATEETLDKVKEKVSAVKSGSGQQPSKFMTLKLEADVKDTLDRAIELARQNYGDSVVDGDIVEASVSRCMELIAVAYLQDENNYPEGLTASEFVPDQIV